MLMTALIHSMTGYAALSGQTEGIAWDWDIRSVNARGLDIRMRLADGFEGLEPLLRTALAAALARGSVSITLKLGQRAYSQDISLNEPALARAIELLGMAAQAASAANLQISAVNPADLLQIRGVIEQGSGAVVSPKVLDAAEVQITPLVDALVAMRTNEGTALKRVLSGQIKAIAQLTTKARAAAESRAAVTGALLKSKLAALLAAGAPVEPDRLAQELALLAVKADITEELDRLTTHIDAATALLDAGGPVGRRLDFLMQEFNREANTLCSKSQSTELTAIGLDIKLVIDQMREQVQNLE